MKCIVDGCVRDAIWFGHGFCDNCLLWYDKVKKRIDDPNWKLEGRKTEFKHQYGAEVMPHYARELNLGSRNCKQFYPVFDTE